MTSRTHSNIVLPTNMPPLPKYLLIGATLCGLLIIGIALAYTQVHYSPSLALVLLVSIPIGIAMVIYPIFSLLLVIFAIPLESLNQIGGLPAELSLFKVLSVAALGGIVLHFIVFRRRERLNLLAPQNLWLSLFVMAALTSSFVAISPQRTLAGISRLARVLLLYPMIISVVKSNRDLRRVTWAFLLSGLLCTLYGIFTYYFAPDLIGVEGRISGTMDDPNEFAAAMVTRIPLALELLLQEKRRWPRILLALTAAAFIYGVILSGSRGGILALVTAFLLSVLNRKRKLQTLIVVIAIMALIFGITPVHYKERWGLAPGSQEEAIATTNRRWTYQVLGVQIIQEHPILGIGLDGFAAFYSRSVYRFLQKDQVQRIAHNTYLEIAVGVGLLGLIPLAGLLATSLNSARKAGQSTTSPSEITAIAKGVFASLGGFLVACAFLSQQYEKTLWLLIALTVVVQQLQRESNYAQIN